jgi:hypothetical protein
VISVWNMLINFLKWGGSDMPSDGKDPDTGEDVTRYDYGGAGDLSSGDDREMYEVVVKRIMEEIYFRNLGDEKATWREWRFGYDDKDKEDIGYEDRFNVALETFMRGNGELDSDEEVSSLLEAVSKLQGQLVFNADFAGDFYERMNKSFSGKVVSVDNVDYSILVEEFEGSPLLIYSADDKRYGLKFNPTGRAMSDFEFWDGNSFERVRLDYFPVSLVVDIGGNWVDFGERGVYSLPENYFEEVYRATAVNKFLEERC